MQQDPVSPGEPLQQAVEESSQQQFLTSQEKAVVQHKVARMAFVGLGFLLVFSIVAGVYWYVQNKTILQQASKKASVSSLTVVTPMPGQPQHSQELMINLHALPLGDGKVSTSPKSGYIYSCQTTFQGGGAQESGSWIDGNTWDLGEKISVDGSVSWPNAQFSLTTQGDSRIITGNGLPISGTTGVFPISPNDPAYQVDRNPNSIKAQSISLTLPKDPQLGSPTCLGGGVIGIALNGVAIFDGLDAGGRDAVAHEMQDSCGGHPQQEGMYHYHGPSPCIPGADKPNALLGYALDGFGIYSDIDENGNQLMNSDLDECHGITSQIMWDGKKVTMYHYVVTQEYPYTIGCFRGSKVVQAPGSHMQQQGGMPPPPGSGSLQGAYPPPPGVNGY